MQRDLEPYAVPTDTTSGLPSIGAGGQLVLPGATRIRPTPYRYAVLIERTKQLVQLAVQIESAFLSALEKADREAYDLLTARANVRLAQAGVTLQNLRVTVAQGNEKLAQVQKDRVQKQYDHYVNLLQNNAVSDLENQALGNLQASRDWTLIAAASAGLPIIAGVVIGSIAGPQGNVAGAAAGAIASMITGGLTNAIQSYASAKGIESQIFAMQASFERRRQDWEFQKALSDQDRIISDQQITIAQDNVRVVEQESVIEQMKADHAKDVLDFLTNKFTSKDLYDWMSGVLERVYSFFVQQATAMAKLAERQLAFERQEAPLSYIQTDYWEMPSEEGTASTSNGKAPDRRGLTGSARLLQDIYQLDQYAFETNKRKHQLTKTIALAQLDPFAFQQFRETGVMTFATPMHLFDHDFPGHYLRLITRVRTSVVALIPPTQGIRATLSFGGLSRVVIAGDIFQQVVVQRDPETVALSSPLHATGLFELEQQADMLFPFEGIGVDTTWEFRMPKAANPFDYRTIGDVLITIEYTALNSFDYRQQVIQQLDHSISADHLFSFRYQFADAWYDLHNPDQATPPPMTVHFRTMREDFPPNLEGLKIEHVVLYFARVSGKSFEVPVTHLRFTEQNASGALGGGAISMDGVISTRRGNAGSWTAMIGKAPVGQWELALPDIPEIRNLFKAEEIEDILFVLTYTGRTPEWPV